MIKTIPQDVSAPLTIRQALPADLPTLTALMEDSVRQLGTQNYSQEQLESALAHIFGIDPELVEDGTYYVAEIDGTVAGCGGWSRRSTLYGKHQAEIAMGQESVVPSEGAAKIRAFFVHPHYARRGVGRQLMQTSEAAASENGGQRLELVATLTGVGLYRKCGFHVVDTLEVVTPDGITLQAIRMEKELQ